MNKIDNRASATKMAYLGSIPRRVKPKTLKFDIHSFRPRRLVIKEKYESSTVCFRQVGRWQLDSKNERPFALSCQGVMVSKNVR